MFVGIVDVLDEYRVPVWTIDLGPVHLVQNVVGSTWRKVFVIPEEIWTNSKFC